MGEIKYVEGDLFKAPKGSIIIHAVNRKGVWGSGIAKGFADRFPLALTRYRYECFSKGDSLLGSCLLIPSGDYTIGCLFTSKNYGKFVDPKNQILKNTKNAINDLIVQNINSKELHMCKINSGLFRVPWIETEKILLDFNEKFTVYSF